jgi:molecular chaperone GrpE
MGEPEQTPVATDEAANDRASAEAANGRAMDTTQPRAVDAGAATAGAAGAAEPAQAPDPLRAAQAELLSALAKAQEHYDQFMRARAETENVRRRAQEDIAKAHKYAVESFAEALVPVMDSLEKALEANNASAETLRAGVEITLKQLAAAFEKGRLLPIDPRGEKFDPHRHQAISVVPGNGVAANHVVAVLQKGWMLNDRVLRPALVTVAQG